MRRVVCITGMHRSGTSLAASWLQRCQLPIADGRILGPGPGNPRGHFEDLDFSELQDRSIKRTFGSWRATEPQPLDFDDDERKDAARLIERRNDAFPVWGWKDPRSVLFLNQWKRLRPDLKALIVWRPCAEVVESLMARARVAPVELDLDVRVRDAARIWASYNRVLCAFTAAHPADVILVRIDTLIDRDRELADDLNARWQIGLRHVPIALLRDASLLQRQPGLRSRLGAWVSRSSRVERRLQALSWPGAD